MEEITTKKNIRDNIFQSNYLTQSYLPFTKLESNLMAIILSTLKTDNRNYIWNIRELCGVLKIDVGNSKEIVNAVNGLYEKSIVIKHHTDVEKIRLLSRVKYPDDDNISINDNVEITISSEISPHLFNLKKLFSVYETASYLRLNSLISKKLYTTFSQYKNMKHGFQMSPDEIQDMLQTNYNRFSVLMTKNIKPAIKEIEEKTNVDNVRVVSVKSGRNVIGYRFFFDWMNKQMELPLLPPSMNPKQLTTYERLMTDFWLSNYQAKKVIEEIPLTEINKTLHQITLQKSEIKNVGAYTISIMKKRHGLVFE